MRTRILLAGGLVAMCGVASVGSAMGQTVWYVDGGSASACDGSTPGCGTRWDLPFELLNDALDAVTVNSLPDADQIWVAEGTYVPGDNVDAFFDLKSGVEVYGGFVGEAYPGGGETDLDQRDSAVNVTILSGQFGPLPADKVKAIVKANGHAFPAVLDGFTISGPVNTVSISILPHRS